MSWNEIPGLGKSGKVANNMSDICCGNEKDQVREKRDEREREKREMRERMKSMKVMETRRRSKE